MQFHKGPRKKVRVHARVVQSKGQRALDAHRDTAFDWRANWPAVCNISQYNCGFTFWARAEDETAVIVIRKLFSLLSPRSSLRYCVNNSRLNYANWPRCLHPLSRRSFAPPVTHDDTRAESQSSEPKATLVIENNRPPSQAAAPFSRANALSARSPFTPRRDATQRAA